VGSAGPPGPQGNTGPTGAQGLIGATGPIGPAGASGAMGPAGAQGSRGPAGPTGPTGATDGQGPAGAAGPAGTAGVGLPTNCVAGDVVVQYGGAWTCSPSGLPRYVANGDGTVTDTKTGLMWEMQTFTCAGEVTCYSNTYTWSLSSTDATADGTLFTSFMAGLNGGDYYSPALGLDVSNGAASSCFANHCDWRIPTVVELTNILSFSANPSTCVDPAFGPALGFAFWSSSTLTAFTPSIWLVAFYSISYQGPIPTARDDTYLARAVRTVR